MPRHEPNGERQIPAPSPLRSGGEEALVCTTPVRVSLHSCLAGREGPEFTAAAPSPTPAAVAQDFARRARPVPPFGSRENSAAPPRWAHPFHRLHYRAGDDLQLKRSSFADPGEGLLCIS